MHKKNKNNIITYFIITLCETNRVLLESSQNSRENTRARISFFRPQACNFITLSKKRPWYSCFPVNFVKFLRKPFLIENLRWLLLNKLSSKDYDNCYGGRGVQFINPLKNRTKVLIFTAKYAIISNKKKTDANFFSYFRVFYRPEF